MISFQPVGNKNEDENHNKTDDSSDPATLNMDGDFVALHKIQKVASRELQNSD